MARCYDFKVVKILLTGENIDWFHNNKGSSLQTKVKRTQALDSSNWRRSASGSGCWIWNGLLRWQLAIALVVCCKARRPLFRRKRQSSGYQMSSSETAWRWTLNS